VVAGAEGSKGEGGKREVEGVKGGRRSQRGAASGALSFLASFACAFPCLVAIVQLGFLLTLVCGVPPFPCPQPSPHHVHLSSPLPRASGGDAAMHQSLARRGKVTKVIYWGRFFFFLAFCDMNWALRESADILVGRGGLPLS